MKVFKSRRVVIAGQVCPATIYTENGQITEVTKTYSAGQSETGVEASQVCDFGDLVVMPGVVDSHVHVNEPGRTQWEGYETATRAAAAGGITTIVDMPLNSIPTTVSVGALQTKLTAARDQCYVDVAFWGGVVPGNEAELVPMLDKGVCGFKCFMIHSGIDDFPFVTEDDIRAALKQLQGTNCVLLFHAEVETDDSETDTSGDVKEYDTFLKSRPQSMEVAAVKLVCQLAAEYGVRCHIVHLSAAEALPVLKAARSAGAPVTVETTHHYLCLSAEDVPQMATQYKCCPPIRNHNNKELLWEAVRSGDIDMVVSDHSPCTADLKLMDSGDFIKAWGGVSSVQFGLSLFWTEAEKRGFTLTDVVDKLCDQTARLGGLRNKKGAIEVGLDADFVVWDPEATITVETDGIHHKNKVTPYLGQSLRGKVRTTIVRGHVVYDQGRFSDQPMGKHVLLNNSK